MCNSAITALTVSSGNSGGSPTVRTEKCSGLVNSSTVTGVCGVKCYFAM